MVITKDDVKNIAKLSRLSLTESEMEEFTPQLDKIFGHVQELNQIDTSSVEPTSHAIPVSNVFREDEVVEFDNKEGIINNGPKTEDNAFVVPKIV